MILLKGRGLLFHDEQAALSQLKTLSYFRIAGYLRPMEDNPVTHTCMPNCYFEQAVDTYYFDKELRALLFTAIQSVEVAIRTRLIDRTSFTHGAFWFMDPALATDTKLYQSNYDIIRNEVNRSKEDFIVSHFVKYDSPDCPPIWKTLEVISFGTLSKLYSNFNDNHVKKQIAKDFGLPQHVYMESWIKSIAVLRNHIAHHARIWNRRFSLKPQLPKTLPMDWIDTNGLVDYKLYPQLCCLLYLENIIHPDSKFKSRLKDLIDSHPDINLHAMGFPPRWRNEALWK